MTSSDTVDNDQSDALCVLQPIALLCHGALLRTMQWILFPLLLQNLFTHQICFPLFKPKNIKKRSILHSHHEPVLHCSFADPQLRTGRCVLRQDAVNGRIQLRRVHFLASSVEHSPVLLHEQGDVLPVTRGQVHVLHGNHLLLVLRGENYVQSVGFAVGDDLEDGPGAVPLLHGQEASPGAFELFQIEQQEESPLGVDGVNQVPEGGLGERGDQVRVEDLVGRAVRVVSLHRGDSVVLLGDLDEIEQVVDAVVVPALCG